MPVPTQVIGENVLSSTSLGTFDFGAGTNFAVGGGGPDTKGDDLTPATTAGRRLLHAE